MASKGLAALIFISMFSWPASAAGLEPDGSGPPAHVTIASFRLTDDSDHDGIADPTTAGAAQVKAVPGALVP